MGPNTEDIRSLHHDKVITTRAEVAEGGKPHSHLLSATIETQGTNDTYSLTSRSQATIFNFRNVFWSRQNWACPVSGLHNMKRLLAARLDPSAMFHTTYSFRRAQPSMLETRHVSDPFERAALGKSKAKPRSRERQLLSDMPVLQAEDKLRSASS